MGHKSSLQDFHTKHKVMCNEIDRCIKGFHSNACIDFKLLKDLHFTN